MKLRWKLLVDTLLGRPAVALLNLIAYPLGHILHRDHGLDTTRVIVVCKLMGLGSIVQITPLLAALRKGFPGARIVFLTRRQNRAYCERIDAIDETLAIDDTSAAGLFASLLGTLRRLWSVAPDLFINLEVYSNLGALLTITSCARNRLGYYKTPRDQRAWGIYTHMVYFNRNAQISEVYLQAARCLGLAVLGSELVAPRIDAADEESLRAKLQAAGVAPGPTLLVNPNSSELSHERRWPPAAFAEALAAIHGTHPGLQYVIVGGPGEEATGEALRRALEPGPRVYDLTGRLSLPELMALLRGADAFLTNDSGPMHLAFSLRVPTVGLFGPVSPDHYGSVAAPERLLLYRRLYCSPCVHHFLEAPCRGDNRCMKLITPQEVAAAVDTVLRRQARPGTEMPLHYAERGVVFGTQQREGRRGTS